MPHRSEQSVWAFDATVASSGRQERAPTLVARSGSVIGCLSYRGGSEPSGVRTGGPTPIAWDECEEGGPSGLSPEGLTWRAADEEAHLRACDALLLAQRNLGLNKTALAEICGVTRQTIYDWLNERHEPEGANLSRLRLLYDLASRDELSTRPISSRLVKRETAQGMSLLDVLTRPQVDAEALEVVLQELRDLSERRRSRGVEAARERLGWRPLTEEQKQHNLLRNVDSSQDE